MLFCWLNKVLKCSYNSILHFPWVQIHSESKSEPSCHLHWLHTRALTRNGKWKKQFQLRINNGSRKELIVCLVLNSLINSIHFVLLNLQIQDITFSWAVMAVSGNYSNSQSYLCCTGLNIRNVVLHCCCRKIIEANFIPHTETQHGLIKESLMNWIDELNH